MVLEATRTVHVRLHLRPEYREDHAKRFSIGISYPVIGLGTAMFNIVPASAGTGEGHQPARLST